MQKYKNRVALHITRQKDQKMVYKKYIKRGDKVFGPYYYSSYREGNKVKTSYLRVKEKYQNEVKKRKLFAITAAFLIMVVLFFFLKPSIIGLATNEPSLTLSPIQSHPMVRGNWIVRLNTKGAADLTITPINGTTWSNVNEDNQLKFLEIRCGDKVLGYKWVDDSVLIPDYNCDETAYHTVKVFRNGTHVLEFNFGDSTKYADSSPRIQKQNKNKQKRGKCKTKEVR